MGQIDDRLEALAGEWDVVATLDGERMSSSIAIFEWIAGGDFLFQRSEVADLAEAWQGRAPTWLTSVIGSDDPTGRYAYLYADSRGVHRAYEMTLADREWRIRGQAGPEFHQRFLGVLSDDGERIDGRWERSVDGASWELDFEVTYARR
jgi:hypothetical protein